MALEAVVYPQDPFSYSYRDSYSTGGSLWGYDLGFHEEDKALLGILDESMEQNLRAKWDSSPPSLMQHAKEWDPNYSSSETCTVDQSPTGSGLHPMEAQPVAAPPNSGRRKRRRTKTAKNKEELENQRMTHIAVERNRRKQMNEYLAVLRSLMPPSYVQRGDQASIIGGAINFVKELEQQLQSMEVHKRTKKQSLHDNVFSSSSSSSSLPFAGFFTFPQYSTRATQTKNSSSPTVPTTEVPAAAENDHFTAAADIEVNMVDSHANLKILCKKRPRQLLKLMAGFHGLRLSVLHLNVTSVDEMVLYSVSVKVEEGSQLNTVDDIAAAVNQMLRRIEEEGAFS